MKKLAVVLVLALTVFSCTPDPICGVVSGKSFHSSGERQLHIVGAGWNFVTIDDYNMSTIGDYFCIY